MQAKKFLGPFGLMVKISSSFLEKSPSSKFVYFHSILSRSESSSHKNKKALLNVTQFHDSKRYICVNNTHEKLLKMGSFLCVCLFSLPLHYSFSSFLLSLSESFNFSEYDDFYNENFDSHLDELFAESGESDTNSSSSAYEIDINEPIGASQEDGEDGDDDDDVDFVDDDEDFIPLLEDEITERFGLALP